MGEELVMEERASITLLLEQFGTSLKELSERLTRHMENEECAVKLHTEAVNKLREEVRDLGESVEALSGVVKAFPHVDDGTGDKVPDFHGHRRDHEYRMESAKESSKFWQAMKVHAGTIIVSGLMGLLLLGATTYILDIVEKGQIRAAEIASRRDEGQSKAIEEAIAKALASHDAKTKGGRK